jgi:hypothetical protein
MSDFLVKNGFPIIENMNEMPALINDENVRFRNGGTTESQIIRKFLNKEHISLIQYNHLTKWYKVSTEQNEVGFVYGEYVMQLGDE